MIALLLHTNKWRNKWSQHRRNFIIPSYGASLCADYWSTESEDGLMSHGLFTWMRCADCVTSSTHRRSCCALHYSAVQGPACAEAVVEHQQSGLLSIVQLLWEINAGYLCVMERLLSMHKLFVQFCGIECISRSDALDFVKQDAVIELCKHPVHIKLQEKVWLSGEFTMRTCNFETKMRGFTTYALTSARPV